MPITLKPNGDRPADLDVLLGEGLDRLAQLGAKTDHPKLKPARKIAEQLPPIRELASQLWRRDLAGEINDAARRVVSGELTAADIPSVAVAIDAATDKDYLSTTRKIIDRAQHQVDNEAAAVCRTIGDAWVVEVLRPAVQRTMEQVTPELVEAAWTAVNTSRSDHTRPQRDALEQVEDLITTLDLLADEALAWRNYGWVPTPPRDDQGWQAEGFRWLHHDRLGDPQHGTYAAFFLAGHRDGAEHGIFTCDEILQANKPPEAARKSATGPQNLTFAAAGV